MHKYRVIDCCADENRIALEGGVGRYHQARVLGAPPRVGDLLYGSRPHMGFGLLQCSRSGHTFRVIFETINGDACALNADRMAEPLSKRGQGSAPADQWGR